LLNARWHWKAFAGVLMVAMLLSLLLSACGSTPTPQVLVVTATFTPEPQVVVVTATFTPTPEVVPSDTPQPTPTDTPLPTPTDTPLPTATPSQAQSPAQPEVTDTPLPPPTDTPPPPPTDTPLPTDTPPPTPTETHTPQPTAKPQTSLKSYFVVYTSFQGPDVQNYSLWGMNGDGSGAFKILDLASEPNFSPDGNKFAFYHWTDGLYVWDLVKQTSVRLVDNTEAAFVTWAPNAKRLAYCNLLGQPQIYIVNADGTDNHALTPGLRPNWSQNGGFIAYDTCENNKCGIYRINPDGGGKRQLTSDAGGGAAVSPNGKKITYWSREDGDFEIFVVNADGSGRKQLTKNKGNDALPAWSPDGQYIYYLSDQNGKAWAVMVMNANGSNQRKIINVGASADPGRGWQYQRITVTWN
jgi:Tol biopolymer transport system component